MVYDVLETYSKKVKRHRVLNPMPFSFLPYNLSPVINTLIFAV